MKIRHRSRSQTLLGPIMLLALCLGVVLMVISPWGSGLTLASAAVVVFSCWTMHKAVRLFNLRALTIPGFFFFAYLAVIVVPAFFVYAEQIDPFRRMYLFAVQSVLLTVPLGIFFSNWILRFDPREVRRYFERPLSADPLDRSPAPAFLWFLLFGIIVAGIHFSLVQTVPLLYLLRNPGDFFAIAELREDAAKLLNSQFDYLFYLARGLWFPYLTLLAFGRYLTGRRGKWLLLFGGTFITATLYAAMTIEKSPVALIVAMILILFYLYRGGKPGKKLIVLAPVLYLAFPIFVLMNTYSGRYEGTLAGALSAMADRIFHGPAFVLYYYFEVFPDFIPFQHGAGIGKLAMLMGEKTHNIPNMVGLYIVGHTPGFVSTISANCAFVGHLYADFGVLGVLIGGFIAGVLMQMMQTYLVRQPKDIYNIAIYSFVMFKFGMLVASPLPVTMLSEGVALVFVIAWAMKRFESVLSELRRSGVLRPRVEVRVQSSKTGMLQPRGPVLGGPQVKLGGVRNELWKPGKAGPGKPQI